MVSGLSCHTPQTAEEILEMLERGNNNRTQHPTEANATSSRSHAVFQVCPTLRVRACVCAYARAHVSCMQACYGVCDRKEVSPVEMSSTSLCAHFSSSIGQ